MAEVSPPETGAAGRVRTFLEAHGLAEGLVHFDCSTETAAMAADVLGCDLGQIVKSLVFVVDGTPVLALIAGDRKGDARGIAAAAGGGKATFADADTVLAATGYPVGGVSPFDLAENLVVLVDDSLMRFDVLYTAGGTAASLVRIEREALLG
ncbi:MAG: aminoacyl-tRNA deacylase, partial [Actinobacteria bacterium HGW-Actinobacteria-10]